MAYKKKIVMLGDSCVGKTSLVRRFVFDSFEDSYITTIGSKTTTKDITIKKGGKDEDITLVVWDILGRVGYKASHARMFAGTHGAILVTDLTRRETLHSLERYWIPLLFEVVENVPIIFISNKSDLISDIEFGPKQISLIAARYNFGVMETMPEDLPTMFITSAKTGDNVEKAFESLGHMLLSDKIPKDPIKELYESLVAEGIYRESDKKTLIGATDALIVDFCQGYEDEKLAMHLLRQEVARAGLDIAKPTKEALARAVEYMAEAETEYLDEKTVIKNRDKRLAWAKGAGE